MAPPSLPAASLRYLAIAGDLIQKVAATLSSKIERAAEICAHTNVNDGLVFSWRGGHSRRSVEKMFPRIGSFPGVDPMVELALTFYTKFVGADRMPQSFFAEQPERYAEAALVNCEFGPHNRSMVCCWSL